MEDRGILPQLTVPEQKLPALTFCDANPKALEDWVSQLPMANIGESAKRLYQGIIELNQLITTPANRQALLEKVRQPIHYICKELSKHYLNQSIVLPEKQRKIANLSQALQLHLAGGYKSIIMETLSDNPSDKIRKGLALPIHRAISDLSHCILRACQLYCQSPPNCWLEIHQLYQCARRLGLDSQSVEDHQSVYKVKRSIEEAYKRILLLGCSKPNQIRQTEIEQLFEVFEEWATYTHVDQDSSQTLFIINPDRDGPPRYRNLSSTSISRSSIGFEASDLVSQITDYLAAMARKQNDASDLPMPVRLPDNVLTALSQALGILTKRTFKRIESHDKIQITVGLSATHFHCSEGRDFTEMMQKKDDGDHDANYHLRYQQRKDVWGGGGRDSGPTRDERGPDLNPITYSGSGGGNEHKVNYPHYSVNLVNTSPGGYCMQWVGSVPANVQAGELLGVREGSNQPWAIAVIRWVRQIRQQGTQFGVELLAPGARPCGVQMLQKTGDSSEFLRALLLDELPAIGQPASLITPRLPFQMGHRVMINEDGKETKAQLNRRMAATSSFSQFELNITGGLVAKKPSTLKPSNSEDDFDSLWPSL